ncbi:MAG: dihydroneopterin aldolase [Pseudomonadales bacterium]|nr:dihydroneopterin aldolase [Pseudomonadales bacterium]
MRDQIYIRDLEVETIIGLRPQERTKTQPIVINLWMAQDISKAACSQAIDETLDYGEIARKLTHLIKTSEYYLIEALAEAITEMLQNEFQVAWFRLQLSKPKAVANAREVGLIIERSLETPRIQT